MIRPGVVLGVARAELRLTRRLVRYWLFVGLASLFGLLSYVYYAVIHYFFSSWSATVSSLNPRFLVVLLGLYYIMIMMLGLVFLGFDLRARDTRERMVEVLDARPCTTLELLFGKYLGILLPAWIPIVVIGALLAIIGSALKEPIELYSLIGFVVFMILPAFAFTLGLVFLVTLLVRHRGLAAVLLIGLVVGMYAILFITPIWLIPMVDFTGAYTAPFPSDIVSKILDWPSFLQRAGVLLAGLALVFLAAALHPRRDDTSAAVKAGAGLALLALAVVLAGIPTLGNRTMLNNRKAWRAAHLARQDEPAPNVMAVSGLARISPGRRLELELELRFRAPDAQPLDAALFSFNPGLEVGELTDGSGQSLSFSHEQGLLEVELGRTLSAGEQASIHLAASGKPDPGFAYLDGFKETLEISPWDGQIFLLGYEPIIFDRRFVALLPGARWLPASGTDVGRDDPNIRPTDFFNIDLAVELPEGWLVAGPGRRRDEGVTDGRSRFRFAPHAPVPGVALVAGRFESRSVEIEEITVEALVHPGHAGSLEVFSDSAEIIRDWLAERLSEAAELGLSYPYDGLTMVEVTGGLRGFSGGWRMDSTLAQPAMLLMRESGFPTARFDREFKDPEDFADREGGMPQAKFDVLKRFFENDFNGGNPFIGAARSFFGFVTGSTGKEGLPLNFVFEDLTNRLVSGQRGYFSVHIFNNTDLNQTVGQTLGSFLTGQGGVSVAEAVINAQTSRVEVWDTVLDTSLVDLDPWEEPQRTVDVLTLKGGAMAHSMLDELGHEKAGQLLAVLRDRHEGETFDGQDVVAVGQEIGADLQDWLDLWISHTTLPGFTSSDVRVERISDTEDGTPRYQLLLRVRNEETTPGLIRIDYHAGDHDGGGHEQDETEPIRVEGRTEIEIGIVTSKPPHSVRLVPYLSLNRTPIALPLPGLDEEDIAEAEPFEGVREIDWSPDEQESIVVDDLDEGFSVEEPESRGMWRFAGRGAEIDTDQGLPVFQFGRAPSRWSRRPADDAWGKYRRTVAMIRSGKGEHLAVFAAEIPDAGRWLLECHLPAGLSGATERYRNRLEDWNIAVVDANGDRYEIGFDAKGSSGGWNSLEELDLPQGDVRVELSNASEGRVIIADAIRWSPSFAR